MTNLKGKILLIEDEIEESEPLKDLLEDDGYEVQIAVNGIDGIEKAINFQPDVIIMDMLLVQLGDMMDGFEVIKRLRSIETTKKLGIISWTKHYVTTMEEKRALQKGADDFLRKDVEYGVLEARIKALIRRQREEKRMI